MHEGCLKCKNKLERVKFCLSDEVKLQSLWSGGDSQIDAGLQASHFRESSESIASVTLYFAQKKRKLFLLHSGYYI